MEYNFADDNLLASLIRNDSLEAFKSLYDRYKRKLYSFSLRYLDDNDDAEELVQIVFVGIWEHRRSFDETRSIKSYIYKSAVNNIYNHLKKKAIRSKYIHMELQKPERSANQTYEQIFSKDLEIKIENIIGSLPQQQQKIFVLSRSEGLSNPEIAKKLELSVRTVENQIYRVIKLLKEQLKAEILS